jgi:predicted dehydrogenase
MKTNRRKFLSTAASLAAAALPGPISRAHSNGDRRPMESTIGSKRVPLASPVRFSVVGLNHSHVYSQVETVKRGGGQLISFYAKEPDLADAFSKRYPQATLARTENEILEDNSIQLVVSAAIPVDRAPLGIRVMRHGKDFMTDKPGIITLEQLAEVKLVQKETKRIYSILYGGLEDGTTLKAAELVKAGAIGKVIQTIGLGPHRLNLKSRPEWFFNRNRYGGIICDIGSHQCDHFLIFTGSTQVEVVASQAGNVHHASYPGLQDFGDATLRGDGGTGYFRVDWLTPDGLSTWGDERLTILGTEGFMELRQTVDIGGREGGNHLFLVDQKETRYFDCSKQPLLYGERLTSDILNRTETAMSQQHCFLATELALKAQAQASTLKFRN